MNLTSTLFLLATLLQLAASRTIPIPTPPPPCSVALCTLNGPNFPCFPNFTGRQASRQTSPQAPVTSCEMWAKATKPNCNFICPLFCRVPPLVATNGQTFCNLCLLRAASCRSNFTVFGPVCTLDYCVANGASTPCVIREKRVASTCGEWGKGKYGPNCIFPCAKICMINGPCGSDGVRYCSLCFLKGSSCKSHFKIYGPVPCPPKSAA